MVNTLFGKNVLITRPAQQADNLQKLLELEGAKIISLPTIEIVATTNTAPILRVIKKLNEYDIIIFTSVNAVNHSIQFIETLWSIIPNGIQFAAIGLKTKLALEKQGFDNIIYPQSCYSSETLLELEPFREIKNKRILIMTGKNGRDHLTKTLRFRQAHVTEVICYERKVPKYSNSTIIESTKNDFDFIVCTSNESLENLAKILGSELLAKFKHAQLIGFSTRIESLVKSLGFIKTPIIVSTISDQGIVETIRTYDKR